MKIGSLLEQSTSIYKDNIRAVICILMKDNDFLIFFINIFIDFRINSLDESELITFFNNYTFIDTSKPVIDLANELHLQIKRHFGSLILKGKYNSTHNEQHINIIPYDTFHSEHLPDLVVASLNDIYSNPKEFIEERINNELDGAASLRLPYRKKDDQKRTVWLAKYDELSLIVNAYCVANSLDEKVDSATAINDILGLGFKDSSRPLEKTLLFYLVFPETFNQVCFKPTFADGPLWGYEGGFFLGSVNDNGYGLTNSTNFGLYQASECVTFSLELLTTDFKLGVLGYAEAIIDRSNIKTKAIQRLRRT